MTHDVTVLLWISPRERGLGWQDRRHLHIQLGGNHEDTRRDRDRAACGRRQRSAADEGSRRRWLTCSCDDGHGHSIQQRRARAHFFGRPSVDHLHHQGKQSAPVNPCARHRQCHDDGDMHLHGREDQHRAGPLPRRLDRQEFIRNVYVAYERSIERGRDLRIRQLSERQHCGSHLPAWVRATNLVRR